MNCEYLNSAMHIVDFRLGKRHWNDVFYKKYDRAKRFFARQLIALLYPLMNLKIGLL